MKIKALSRPQSSISRECIGDIQPIHRNLNPTAHPMHRSREYVRAVTSAKLDRMFAKPFLFDLEGGHQDGITCMSTCRSHLVKFVSGSVDGCVKVWDLTTKRCVTTYNKAHVGEVTGVAMCDFASRTGGLAMAAGSGSPQDDATNCLSCGVDGMVRMWRLMPPSSPERDGDENTEQRGLIQTWRHTAKDGGSFKSLDVFWSSSEHQFATASDIGVDIWSPHRSHPLQSYSTHEVGWGTGDTVTTVRYNPSEHRLLAHASMDRGIGLHDVRVGSELRKTIMRMRSNDVAWNPYEPMTFTVANEDHTCYTFDMRNLTRASMVHKGHVGAVLSVSYAPTGKEFVAGSYDGTMRIFPSTSPKSRDMYYTKRMQRVFSVAYTHDNQFILSGSDDTNIRLWKVDASEQVGKTLNPREEAALKYRTKLRKKFAHMPEVERIEKSGQRRGPKTIRKQRAMEHLQKEKEARKRENVMKHSKEGSVKFEGAFKKGIVKVLD